MRGILRVDGGEARDWLQTVEVDDDMAEFVLTCRDRC